MGYRAVIVNDGNAPIPIEVTIAGQSVNPTVTNSATGEYIRLERALQDGESIYINTDPDRLAVNLITIDPATNRPIESNGFGYIGDSTLFQLVPGQNTLVFSSDDTKRVSIQIKFYKRFIGL